MSRAWPVPWATTLTTMPVFCLNRGRIKPNSPESSVEVVEATRMDLSCARADALKAMAATAIRQRRISISIPPVCPLDEQFPSDELLCLVSFPTEEQIQCGQQTLVRARVQAIRRAADRIRSAGG